MNKFIAPPPQLLFGSPRSVIGLRADAHCSYYYSVRIVSESIYIYVEVINDETEQRRSLEI